MNDGPDIDAGMHKRMMTIRRVKCGAHHWPPPVVDIEANFGLWIQMNFYSNPDGPANYTCSNIGALQKVMTKTTRVKITTPYLQILPTLEYYLLITC